VHSVGWSHGHTWTLTLMGEWRRWGGEAGDLEAGALSPSHTGVELGSVLN
jgi:hypothetical protein